MNQYIAKIFALFTSGKFEKSSAQEFYAWLVNDDKREEKDEALKSLWDQTVGDSQYDNLHAWASIQRKTMKPRQYNMGAFLKFAAVAALLAVTSWTTYFLTRQSDMEMVLTEVHIPSGQDKVVVLPDGTVVHANSETLLIYPENFEGNTRTVILHGEANFKVKNNPEKPFVVRSNDFAVTALGTEFKVSAYADDPDVLATLIEGRIKVDCSDTVYYLNPGEQVAYNKQTRSSNKSEVNLHDATAWNRGSIVFRGATLHEVFKVLERQYDVKFMYNATILSLDEYNFEFSNDESLASILNTMQLVIGKFRYELKDKLCIIK